MLTQDIIEMIYMKLHNDDFLILYNLIEHKASNPQVSRSKEEIQNYTNLTSARTSNALIRLEVTCLIDRYAGTKPQRFYYTENGKKMFDYYQKKVTTR